jgi:DNA repair and recombination protein RAD54B
MVELPFDFVVDEMLTSCLRRKFTNKKHKTWDGDGVLSVVNGYATLQDVSGRNMGRTQWKTALLPGSALSIAGKEVEVDESISKADFLAGKPFLGGANPTKTVAPQASFKKPTLGVPRIEKAELRKENSMVSAPTTSSSKDSIKAFKTPFSIRPKADPPILKKPIPRHNPDAEGAIVMPRLESVSKGKQIVDVVVDPILSRHLREHQREGVKFLYECVMGMRLNSGQGAILADEMGLGKTLQTIALIWTLLKQNPIYSEPVIPVAKRVLIVCPVTLINNWRKEFRKWLGDDRCGVFIEDKNNRLTDFTKGKQYPIMIVGYEKLRTIQDQLKDGFKIDLIVMDEGHRLKTAKNKAALAINSFDTDRKIILTGTPMQNDLSEFFFMADLVNANVLGKYNTFKREFETPIVSGRQPEASPKEVEKGQVRSEELASLTSKFILRRTSEVISKYLPPKTESVVFCRPTDKQAQIYRLVLESPMYGAILKSSEASFQLINILKKLCNSPSLWLENKAEESNPSEAITTLMQSIPDKLLKTGASASSKIQVLDTLLHHLRRETDDKIVIVSNYTSTLDMIQKLLVALDYSWLRLDGQTPATKRQDLVDKFNKGSRDKYFAFLLSAKAGGTGLNLIGANRLILFDVDWNPATDLQAMARIHRDGQKKPCFIYRFIVQGALDEKIYQRQIAKTGLADAVVDSKKTTQGFTTEELRNLFQLDEGDNCPTHTLLNCDCDGYGNAQILPENAPEDDIKSAVSPWGSTMADPAADDSSDEDMEDDRSPKIGAFTSANKIDVAAQEKKVRKILRKNHTDNKMLALMQYLHIDASKIREGNAAIESLVEDIVLLEVLKEENSRVSFVFAKTTG